MKMKIIFSIFLMASLTLKAQNAFWDAKDIQDNLANYSYFFSQLSEQKQTKLQGIAEQKNPQGYDIYFQKTGKKNYRFARDVIVNMDRFLQNPFAENIKTLHLEEFDKYVKQSSKPLIITTSPFIDTTSVFYNVIENIPIAQFDKTDYGFTDLITNNKLDCIDPNTQLPLEITYETPLVAVYNPITGGFHSFENETFSIEPAAYFNALDGKIYKTVQGVQVVDKYNYKDNSIFNTDKNLIAIYQNGEDRMIGVLNDIWAIQNFGANTVPTPYSVVSSPSLNTTIDQPTTSVAPLGFSTQMIDAVAQFLVDRVKGELTVAFFDKFLGKIEESNEMQILFPDTYYLLKNQDLFKIPSMGELWVESFQNDVYNLIPNFESLIVTDTNYIHLKKSQSIKSFRLAYHLMNKALDETPLGEILVELDENLGGVEDEIGLSVMGLNMLAHNVRNRKDKYNLSNDFIPLDIFRTLNDNGTKYLVAFLYYEHKDFFDSVKIKGSPISELISTKHDAFAKNIGRFVYILNRFKKQEELLTVINKNAIETGQQRGLHEYYMELTDILMDMTEFGFRLKYFSHPDEYYKDKFHLIYQPMGKHLLLAIQATKEQDYGQLLLNAMQAFEPVFEERVSSLETEIATLSSKQDINIEKLETKKRRLEILKSTIKNIAFYGGFMVDVLSAQNSVQIKGILDRYALPIGSYSMKRRAKTSIDLNAFPGLYTGNEFEVGGIENQGWVSGVTAPIGFALSWGDKKLFSKRKEHSFSIFIPVIDIGAAFSYRWSDELSGFPEDVKWSQVLSPGAYATWGFRKMPVSVMAGFQYTPDLRTVEIQGIKTAQNAWRLGLNAVVDVPIFNFYYQEKD